MKTKKFLKIALLVVIAALFIWTFVFLYQKSQPKVTVYETIVPEVTDLEKWNREMKSLSSRRFPVSLPKYTRKQDKV